MTTAKGLATELFKVFPIIFWYSTELGTTNFNHFQVNWMFPFLILVINILVVKCDIRTDYPKSGHNYFWILSKTSIFFKTPTSIVQNSSSNVLDLIMTNEEEMIDGIKTLPALELSDHICLQFNFNAIVLKATFLNLDTMHAKLIVLKCVKHYDL